MSGSKNLKRKFDETENFQDHEFISEYDFENPNINFERDPETLAQSIKSFFPFNSLDALDFFVWSFGLFDKPQLEASNAQQSYLRESENPWTL